jgi:3' terminal RNA ribose 2'-O-methyltransferase Hen1
VQHHPLDEKFPEWGTGPYYTVELENFVPLKQLLTHLYVLIPVLDADKHYWIGEAEVEKLLENGKGWLPAHPEREVIVSRYLKFRRLSRQALARLVEEETNDPDAEQEQRGEQEIEIEKPIRLHALRLEAVAEELKASGARRVLDLGCGDGKLLRELVKEKQFDEIVGMDVSYRSLEIAGERLHLDTMPAKQKKRVRLFQGSLTYQDKRLTGFDAAAVVEVIEHLDEPRFAAFELMLFGHAQPERIIITTPNAEYNVRFPTLPAGQFRHKDHRFEWSRGQFQGWATATARKFGYKVEFRSIGEEDPVVGAPTQMGVFGR